MKKSYIILSALFIGLRTLAHEGHAAPQEHGIWAHVLLGVVVAAPFLIGGVLIVRNLSTAKETIKNDKESSNG